MNKHLILLVVLLTSCSGTTEQFKVANSKYLQDMQGRLSPYSDFSSVKISWHVPKENVKKYYIYYGYTPDILENQIEVLVSNLDIIKDKSTGEYFQYTLKGVESSRDLYVAMQAENDMGLSGKTKVVKIEPMN